MPNRTRTGSSTRPPHGEPHRLADASPKEPPAGTAKRIAPITTASTMRDKGLDVVSVGELLDGTAPLGHNNPPSPFDEVRIRIEDLMGEAQNWLDGEPIADDAQAAKVAKLLDEIRKARKAADEARKVEKAPWDAGAQDVQDRYNPLLKRADLAAQAAKDAQTPWLHAIAERQRLAAEESRREADRVNREAEEQARAAREANNLAAIEAADQALEDAKLREKEAQRVEAFKPQVKGGGRALGLRTVKSGKITDKTAFGRWVWSARPDDMDRFLNEVAQREAKNGIIAPGLEIVETKVAV